MPTTTFSVFNNRNKVCFFSLLSWPMHSLYVYWTWTWRELVQHNFITVTFVVALQSIQYIAHIFLLFLYFCKKSISITWVLDQPKAVHTVIQSKLLIVCWLLFMNTCNFFRVLVVEVVVANKTSDKSVKRYCRYRES